jgi:hypothetical protein
MGLTEYSSLGVSPQEYRKNSPPSSDNLTPMTSGEKPVSETSGDIKSLGVSPQEYRKKNLTARDVLTSPLQGTQATTTPELEELQGGRSAKIFGIGAASGITGGIGSVGEFGSHLLQQNAAEGMQGIANRLLERQGKPPIKVPEIPGVSVDDIRAMYADQDIDDILPQVLLPTTEGMSKIFNNLFGNKYEPKNMKESYSQSAGQAVGASLGVGGFSPAAIGSSVVGSATAQTASELGFGPLGQFVAGALGGGAVGGITAAAKVAKNPTPFLARATARVLKAHPNAELLLSSHPNAPFSSLVDSKVAQGVEAIFKKFPTAADVYEKQAVGLVESFSDRFKKSVDKIPGTSGSISIQDVGESFNNAIENSLKLAEHETNTLDKKIIGESVGKETKLEDTYGNFEKKKYSGASEKEAKSLFEHKNVSVVNPTEDFLNNISKREPVTKVTGAAKQALIEQEASSKKAATALYKEMKDRVPTEAANIRLDENARASAVKSMKEKLKSLELMKVSDFAPEQKQAVAGQMKDIISRFERKDSTGKYTSVPISELLDMYQGSNAIIRSREAGYNKLITAFKDDISGSIENWSRTNAPGYSEFFREANKSYAKHFETHHNQFIRGLRTKDIHETMATHGGKQSAIQLLENAFENHPENTSLINGLKRIAVEKAIGDFRFKTTPKAMKDALPKVTQKLQNLSPIINQSEINSYIKELTDISNKPSKQLVMTPDGAIVDTIYNIEKKLDSPSITAVARQGLIDLRDDLLSDLKKSNPKMFDSLIKREASKNMRDRFKDVAKQVKDNPDQFFINKMKSVEGIRSVRKMLDGMPNGEEMINNYSRNILSDGFNEIVSPKDGSFKPATLSKYLKEIETSPYYKELLGSKNISLWKDLVNETKELRTAIEHVGMSEKFYANTSQTAHVASLIETGTHIASGLGSLLVTHNPVPLMVTLGSSKAINLISRMLTDPVFKRRLLNEMKKLNVKNPKTRSNPKVIERNLQKLVVSASTAKEPRKRKK